MSDTKREYTKRAIKTEIEDAFTLRMGVNVRADVDFDLVSDSLVIFLNSGEKTYKFEIDRHSYALHPGDDPAPFDFQGWKELWDDSHKWIEFKNKHLFPAINQMLRSFLVERETKAQDDE